MAVPISEKGKRRKESVCEEQAVPFIGVVRHRLGVDGVGVTTLAAFHGCPLNCRYCLNPACKKSPEGLARYTPQGLYDKVRIDNLYFLATGGGVCFGGGEPLLHSGFIHSFRQLCGSSWRITVETSLAVPRQAVELATECVDDFIVDIKDCNTQIYKAYTGRSNRKVMYNLRYLLEHVDPQHIKVRVPLIEGYNTKSDNDRSEETLRAMGVSGIDRFEYRLPKTPGGEK